MDGSKAEDVEVPFGSNVDGEDQERVHPGDSTHEKPNVSSECV